MIYLQLRPIGSIHRSPHTITIAYTGILDSLITTFLRDTVTVLVLLVLLAGLSLVLFKYIRTPTVVNTTAAPTNPIGGMWCPYVSADKIVESSCRVAIIMVKTNGPKLQKRAGVSL